MRNRNLSSVGLLLLAGFVLAGALVTATASAGNMPQGSSAQGMQSFLISSPHTAEQCLAALDDLNAMAPGLLAKMEFGCMAGDHTGYAIVKAANADAARNMLPESLRASAKIQPLTKFTPEQIKAFHNKM